MENEEKTIIPEEQESIAQDEAQVDSDATEETTESEDQSDATDDAQETESEEAESVGVNERYRLSLNSDTFNAMKSDFDMSLRRLIATMEQKSSEDATLTVKLDIHLTNAGDEHIIPSFAHKVATVLQLKDSRSGYTGGRDYELVWDKKANDYIMRPISDGQQSLFNADSARSEEKQEEPEEQEEAPQDDSGDTSGTGDWTSSTEPDSADGDECEDPCGDPGTEYDEENAG